MNDRLYGIPGAEHMYFDLASAYESQIEPYHDEHDDRPCQIEEWSTYPPGYHLIDVDHLIEWASEWSADNAMLDEDGYEAFENAARAPEVQAAFRAALDLWASKVGYRMADKHLRTYTITWDDESKPLADGEPIYAPKVTP